VILISFALLAIAHAAHACDCSRDPGPARMTSDVIFVGRVVDFKPLSFVDLEVRELFKGRPADRVRIITAQSDCDYFLPPLVVSRGREFLVYGIVRDGKVTVSRCADPGPVDRKSVELQQLRQSLKRSPLE